MRGRTLAGAAAILALSTTLAAAAPAALQRSSNVRAGPGTNYPVIATLPPGATVDVDGRAGSWCQVDTTAGQGYVACSLLAFGGGSGAVAVAPGYGYDDDDYYDYGYGYGPAYGVYVAPGRRHWRHGWRGHDGRGNWAGRPGIGRGTWTGNRGGSSAGVNIPGKRQPGAAASFGRSTTGASPSIGARGSVGGGAAISGGRGGSFGGGGGAAVGGGGGGASVGGRGGLGLSGRP